MRKNGGRFFIGPVHSLIRKGRISFLLLSIVLACGLLAARNPLVTHALLNDSIHQEGQAVAASLDLDFNSNPKSVVRSPIQSVVSGNIVKTIVMITNQGTIPGEICLEPSAKIPAGIKILTARACYPNFKPNIPTKFVLEWEILPLASSTISNYEVTFHVTLQNGFSISKDLTFVGQILQDTPTATVPPAISPTPEATATPTMTAQENGTTISANESAKGFYGPKDLSQFPTAECMQKWDSEYCADKMTFGVSGEICVANEGELTTDRLAILDRVEFLDIDGEFKPLEGTALAVEISRELAPGENRCYPYRIEFDPGEWKVFRNSARIEILNHSGWLPGSTNCPGGLACPFGPVGRADFTLPFDEVPTPQPSPTPITPTPTQPTATDEPTQEATPTVAP